MTQTMAYPQYVMLPVRESNGLGIAGFFIALIGVFIPTGIVAILGLLISLVALGRAPRGFATMGVLVGLFGAVVWIAITGFAVLAALVVGIAVIFAGAAAFMVMQPETIKVTSDMANVAIATMEYQDRNGTFPADLSVLGLKQSMLTDPWGSPYRFQIITDDPGFDVVSAGEDGTMGTADDVALSTLDKTWETAVENFVDGIDQFGERLSRLDDRRTRYERSYRPSGAAAEESREGAAERSPAEAPPA
jgi:hypothetical protein